MSTTSATTASSVEYTNEDREKHLIEWLLEHTSNHSINVVEIRDSKSITLVKDDEICKAVKRAIPMIADIVANNNLSTQELIHFAHIVPLLDWMM